MFYLSNYQIVTSLMRQGLRGVPSLTNRKMGFGGPSPHRVFQHHQPNVANVEARSVAECRRMPLVLRHEITSVYHEKTWTFRNCMGLWHYAEVLRFCWILCLKVELTSNSCTSMYKSRCIHCHVWHGDRWRPLTGKTGRWSPHPLHPCWHDLAWWLPMLLNWMSTQRRKKKRKIKRRSPCKLLQIDMNWTHIVT